MKHRDSLFKLIHSLSKNEKGYFKKYMSRYSSNADTDLVKLFDAIEKQKEYDESKLKKVFAGDNIVKHLSVSKNHLHHSILESLRSYHKDVSVEVKLCNMLHDVEILLRKTLYNDCMDVLNKAKVLAIRYQRYSMLLEIYGYIFRINTMQRKDRNDFSPIANKDYQSQLYALEQQKKLIDLRVLLSKIYFIANSYIVQDKESKKQLVKLLAEVHKMKKDPQLPDSAMIYIYSAMSTIYSFYLGDVYKGYLINKEYLAFWDAHPELIEDENQTNYINCLNNLMSTLMRLGKYAEYKAQLKRLDMLPVDSELTKVRKLEVSALSETMYFIRAIKIEEGIKYIEQVEKEIDEISGYSNRSTLLATYDNFAIIYFLAGNYSRALYFSNKIINDKTNIRYDMKCFHQVFNLVVHYEMKNIDYLEPAVKLSQKYLKAQENSFKFIDVVINFFRQAPFIKSLKDERDELMKLKSELDIILTDAHELSANEYFNFSTWAESKIKKRPLIELVKEKAVKAVV
ncbi:MAG: hypothetical protein ACT4ON_15755 [Bacteroidota bacterium]